MTLVRAPPRQHRANVTSRTWRSTSTLPVLHLILVYRWKQADVTCVTWRWRDVWGFQTPCYNSLSLFAPPSSLPVLRFCHDNNVRRVASNTWVPGSTSSWPTPVFMSLRLRLVQTWRRSSEGVDAPDLTVAPPLRRRPPGGHRRGTGNVTWLLGVAWREREMRHVW